MPLIDNAEVGRAKDSRGIAGRAAVIGAATLLSRILGFLRDLIVAFALGAGPTADAFFVAFRVPNLLRRLFGEGSLTMAFVPVFTRLRRESGDEEAFAMARSTMAWLLLVLGAISVGAIALAEPLTMVIAPGFLDDPELFALTVDLVRICFPYIILICQVALCMGVLNALDHFLAPALAPVALNVGLIAAALSAVAMGWSVPHAMSWGVLIAGVFQLWLQQPFLKARGFRRFGPWSWKHKGVIRTGRLMLPTVVGAAVYQINIVVGTLLASFLAEGSISHLYYADRLVQFPLGIFGVAVSTAALPSLSMLFVEKRLREFKETLNDGLQLTLFISLPAAAGLMALSGPIIELLFERGAFSETATAATADALVAYGVGLPAFALVRTLVSGFYALEDTRTPVKIAAFCLALYIASGVGLMFVMGHVGLALATTISSWANALLLLAALRRRFGPWARFIRGSAPATALSLLVGVGAAGTASLGVWAVTVAPVWVILYFLGARLWGLPEAKMAEDVIRSKLRPRMESKS